MPELDLLAVAAATVAAFVTGAVYYGALGAQLPSESQEMPPWKLAAELARCLVLAAVVAGLASQGGIDTVAGGLLLGVCLWVGFPVVLWAGAMLHEATPARLAALHAGDWLAKLLAIGAIVSV